jgi:hypothetical protein
LRKSQASVLATSWSGIKGPGSCMGRHRTIIVTNPVTVPAQSKHQLFRLPGKPAVDDPRGTISLLHLSNFGGVLFTGRGGRDAGRRRVSATHSSRFVRGRPRPAKGTAGNVSTCAPEDDAGKILNAACGAEAQAPTSPIPCKIWDMSSTICWPFPWRIRVNRKFPKACRFTTLSYYVSTWPTPSCTR